ncbi:MAG: rhodanese-like domain-containing protein [Vampirovibrionales bacterium]|nr:rhodanese-like domain-containing protein [Vampirovibrionales bacterium]
MTDACALPAAPTTTSRKGKRFAQLVADAKTRIQELTIPQLKEWQANGKAFTLIDVREPSDYGEGHIEGAVSIPRGLLELALDDVVVDQDATVVLYCGGGSRSALAADTAQQMGYSNVLSLAGGWRAWAE